MKKQIYHFVGIGGVSMSALAKILYQKGHKITGSDINSNINLPFATIFTGHNAQNVKPCDVVVCNSAIKDDNVEIIMAKRLGKTIITRGELLGQIASEYKNVIAISGMHGKTTTTEMLAEVLLTAKENPTIHLGGISNYFFSNVKIGGKKYFITEACEYSDSFLELKPTISIILNIENEHLDYFKNINNICHSFQKFSNNSKMTIVLDKLYSKVKKENNNCITFGKNAEYTAKNIKRYSQGFVFDCYIKDTFFCQIKLNSIIKENITNALAVIVVCNRLGIDKKYIQIALSNFKGVKRRMEIVNTNPLVIHDYAHHPTEINATINSVKKHYKNKLLVVFQPHTYSRTKEFFKDFITVLLKANKLFLFKTYSARENKIKNATAYNLYLKLKKKKINCYYFDNEKILINSIVKNNDYTTLILGAGDIENIINYLK